MCLQAASILVFKKLYYSKKVSKTKVARAIMTFLKHYSYF